jgi:chromosomal replication initiator protein
MQGIITDEYSRSAGPGSPLAGVQSQTGAVSEPNSAVSNRGRETNSKSSQVSNGVIAINEALAERVGSQKFRIWFKNSTKFTIADGYLKIGVPNLFIANWIENHFLNEINQAVRAATGEKLKITFIIDSELSGNIRRTPPLKGTEAHGILAHRSSSIIHRPTRDGRRGTRDERAGARKPASIGARKLSLENFVVGPSNELAYNAARAIVRERYSPFNPLFIHGGYGLGKTHLLQGICNAMAEKRSEAKWEYMSAEDFTNQFVLALKLKKLETFRRRMRQTDLLAIDDIHFLANKPSTQEEFLHTFNTINLAGKQVVLVSDAHPKMIGSLSEKLVSRFVSGMVVKIDPPDFQTRCEICRQFMAKRLGNSIRSDRLSSDGSKTKQTRLPGVSNEGEGTAKRWYGGQVNEGVIRYIAENLRTNVRELEGAMLKLIAYSALQNEKITLSMAQAVLADHLERCDPIVHISDIESAVATYFGITPANIHSAKKDRTVALARHFSMYLTRKHTKMSSSEVGRFMGNKNHATVLLACKKVEEMIKKNSDVHWRISNGNKVTKAKTIIASLEESISG